MSQTTPAPRLFVTAGLLAAAACAAPDVHFADRALLWHDPDDAPCAIPRERPDPGTGRLYVGAENAIFRPAKRLFTVDYGREAINVNAVDEVPDSSWYHDRRRDHADPLLPPRTFAPAELQRGAIAPDEPPPRPPFTIEKQLSGGSAPGFAVLDALGRRYAIKLDPENHFGLITSTDVVASRLAWASGWRVPGDELVDFDRGDLLIGKGATYLDQFGGKHKLDDGDVDALLWHVPAIAPHRFRAVASRWVDGQLLGFFSWIGREKSDPNDRYPHEDRRDLRGFGVWSAWVDNIDVIENNTLDAYVGERGNGHVLHYQLDVGGSFGSFSAAPALYWMRDESYFQAGHVFQSLFTAGIIPQRWEGERWQRRRRALIEQYPEFGAYAAMHFSPRHWRPIVDIPPFERQTARDRYWGAKRVAAFSWDELRAVVSVGQYRPGAAEYLLQTLWERRNHIAREYFTESTPLDHPLVTPGRLCATDLWVRAGLGGGEATDYRARENGALLAERRGSGHDGALCVPLPARDGYRVIELTARRPGERHFSPPVRVHVIEHAGQPRVVGLVRENR
jgi:hypothetical protein